jgi:hypothetical protein
MAGKSIETVAASVTEIGTLEYLVNGRPVPREDFIALQLFRIAAALEEEVDEEGEGPASDNLFGV